jgi:hypothetical protein
MRAKERQPPSMTSLLFRASSKNQPLIDLLSLAMTMAMSQSWRYLI